jgi:hypothetical protein
VEAGHFCDMRMWNDVTLQLNNEVSWKEIIPIYEEAEIPISVRHHLANWLDTEIDFG